MDRNPREHRQGMQKKAWSRETRWSFLAACLLVGFGVAGLLLCLWRVSLSGNAANSTETVASQGTLGAEDADGELVAQISELEPPSLWAQVEQLTPEMSSGEENASSLWGQTASSGPASSRDSDTAVSSRPVQSSEGSQSAQELSSGEGSQASGEPQDSSESSQASREPQGSSQSPQEQEDDQMADGVWISASGKKYHRTSSCSGMKSPRQVSAEQAAAQGYTPCKRCFRG